MKTSLYVQRAMRSHTAGSVTAKKHIDRAPCFYCGTRGDMGCDHRAASEILTDPAIVNQAWNEAIDEERAKYGFLDVILHPLDDKRVRK